MTEQQQLDDAMTAIRAGYTELACVKEHAHKTTEDQRNAHISDAFDRLGDAMAYLSLRLGQPHDVAASRAAVRMASIMGGFTPTGEPVAPQQVTPDS